MNVSLKYTIITLAVIILFCLVSYLNKQHLNRGREKARRIACASNLKCLGLTLKQYSMDFEGYLPGEDGAEGYVNVK